MPGSEIIQIGLVGDVMIGRNVDKALADWGYDYPWGNLLPLLQQADINIANLETTLTHHTRRVDKVFNFRAAPAHVQSLLRANMHLVNLANNHVLDFGEEGLEETIRTLDAAGIAHAGAGRNKEEAVQPAILVIQSRLRLGLLGCTDNERRWKAGPGQSGIFHVDISSGKETGEVLAMVGRLRPEVDLLVVSIHWGPNMREEPPPPFIDFAHALVEQGADIIHGHSAHIFQGIEIYRGRFILYDAGDFVDDYVVDPVLRNDHSFFYLLEVAPGNILTLTLHPVIISRCQVNVATGTDRLWCLERLQELSSPFGTVIGREGVLRAIAG